VRATVDKLPGALRQTESTLARVDTLGDRLAPAVNALRPPLRRLEQTNAAVRPFVVEATPIVREQLRPFARATQPFVADLGRAATDTVRSLPDLTGSLRGFNRFVNIGAFNPGGAEPLTGDLEVDRNREEGLFFWLAWAGQLGVSLHNTSDATGVLRRVTLCGVDVGSTVEQLTDAVEQLIGPLTEELADRGVPVEDLDTEVTKEIERIINQVATSGFGTCEF
jgi:ABC-type transporter Mla subunit MlaD